MHVRHKDHHIWVTGRQAELRTCRSSHARPSEMLKTTAIRSARACKLSSAPLRRINILQWVSSNNCQPRINTAVRLFSVNAPNRRPAPPTETAPKPTLRENVYTIPNLLTVSRIISCPVLGWSILSGDYHLATGLLVYAGLTDLVCLL